MSSFAKLSSLYQESVDDVLDQLNDIFRDKLNYLFRGLEVELLRPAGSGFAYERRITGNVTDVQLWLSRPDTDVPLLMCRFQVKGVDQFGVDYLGIVREGELITRIPWQDFVPYKKFTVKAE